jgi:hypothetical protein
MRVLGRKPSQHSAVRRNWEVFPSTICRDLPVKRSYRPFFSSQIELPYLPSNDLLLFLSEPSTSTLSSARMQKQSAKPAVFLYLAKSRNTIARDNWSLTHALWIIAREHSL